MLRLVMIGGGAHARGHHGAALRRYAADHPGEIELSGVCDLKREAAAACCRDFGFQRAYTDIDTMLAEAKPDACIAVLPVVKMAEIGVSLLRQGLPCLLEKPPGASLAEAREMAQAARASGTVHMVSTNRRFMPALNRAAAWAREAGPLRHVSATMFRHRRVEPDFIWGTGFHVVDSLRHLAGEIEEVQARRIRGPEITGQWHQALLRFAGGVLGHLRIFPTAGMLEETYELAGENFRVIVKFPGHDDPPRFECWRDRTPVLSETAPPDEPREVINGAYAETGEFVAALRERRPPRPGLDDVLKSAAICQQIAEGDA